MNHLVDISGKTLDLTNSKLFLEIYDKQIAHVQVIINEMNSDKIYEEIFRILNRQNLRILDIGGNIGLFSLYVQPACSKIVAVEPTPYHVEVFSELVDMLGYKNITIIPGAVSDKTETQEFYLNVTNSTMNSLKFIDGIGYDEKLEVKAYTLSDIIDAAGFEEVDFVKLDIEGGEEKVLFCEDFAKASEKIHSIYVEVHQGLGSDLNKCIERLVQVGYTDISLTPYSTNQGVYAKKP